MKKKTYEVFMKRKVEEYTCISVESTSPVAARRAALKIVNDGNERVDWCDTNQLTKPTIIDVREYKPHNPEECDDEETETDEERA